jgi:hypothetical protein
VKIWAAWLQGRSAAPEFVQKNLSLWEALHPNDTFHVVEQAECDRIIRDLGITNPRLTPQVQTDIVRTWLLATEGGVWVDSTLLPTQRLQDWLTDDLMAQGFFAFRSLGDPNLVLQNWFLASEAKNPLTTEWLACFAAYFRQPRMYPSWKRAIFHGKWRDYINFKSAIDRRDTLWFVQDPRGKECVFYPYAVHNYCFALLLKHHSSLTQVWDAVPYRSAHIPLLLSRLVSDPETNDKALQRALPELFALSPVHKLNHRNSKFVQLVDIVAETRGLKV